MNRWIELNSLGSGRRIYLNVRNILWVTPAQSQGRDFTSVKMVDGSSVVVTEDYGYVRNEIEDSYEH